ncbi:hypothetical protein CDAR_498531 [Caerostris darwini]|uniref:Uncharacterized protein n=1 Tax=Caerostris darwini TaxID=1538125 RepID=A0AAV4SMH0_9ARAC|nr:hypothetical protein CDAR_498531 [Caerostris darwini]
MGLLSFSRKPFPRAIQCLLSVAINRTACPLLPESILENIFRIRHQLNAEAPAMENNSIDARPAGWVVRQTAPTPTAPPAFCLLSGWG